MWRIYGFSSLYPKKEAQANGFEYTSQKPLYIQRGASAIAFFFP